MLNCLHIHTHTRLHVFLIQTTFQLPNIYLANISCYVEYTLLHLCFQRDTTKHHRHQRKCMQNGSEAVIDRELDWLCHGLGYKCNGNTRGISEV